MDSGFSIRCGGVMRSRSSQTRPHLVKISGRSAVGSVAKQTSHNFLGMTEPVSSGGIDPVDSQIEGVAHRGHGVRVVLRPPAERPAAATDGHEPNPTRVMCIPLLPRG